MRTRRRSRINWDRFGRVVLVLVLFVVLASYLNPLVNFANAWHQEKAGKQQLAELSREHTRLKQELAEASHDAALIREARERGMVQAGERAYVVHGLPK